MIAERYTNPLFSTKTPSSVTAALLEFEECSKEHAVLLVREWHLRLPNCQMGPWTHAFRGHFMDRTYVVALWNNPSGRCLPQTWRELRRMACAPDAPRNTPSRFLGWMVRWFNRYEPFHEKLISYQDTEAHSGTIYKAAGWVAESTSAPRIRNHKRLRGLERGGEADAAGKVRWAIGLKQKNGGKL